MTNKLKEFNNRTMDSLTDNGVTEFKDRNYFKDIDISAMSEEEKNTIGHGLLNTGDGGNPYMIARGMGKDIKDKYRKSSRYDPNYEINREEAKDWDEDKYFEIIDGYYADFANEFKDLANNETDPDKKTLYQNNMNAILDTQSQFKIERAMDTIYNLGTQPFKFATDVLTTGVRGRINAETFLKGDIPIYSVRLANHLLNTLGEDVILNGLQGGRRKALADITEDETNLYGETFDPGSPTERSGAFLRGFQNKSVIGPEGVRKVTSESVEVVPYLSAPYGYPLVRETAEIVSDLGGLSSALIKRLTKRGTAVADKGNDFITKIQTISETGFKQSAAQFGIGTAARYKYIPGFRAKDYNYAYEATRKTQEGAALMRKYKMGQVGFGVLMGGDQLILNGLLSQTELPTSKLPFIGKEGAVPLVTLDTPVIMPLTYVSMMGMHRFGDSLLNKKSEILANMQLSMKARAMLPDPRFLTRGEGGLPVIGRFGQKKTSKDVIDYYLLNVKRVSPEVVKEINKKIDSFGETIIADRRGDATFTVHDKLLDMWLTRNNPKNRTANPLVQDPKMEAAMNAITEKMSYMDLSIAEVKAVRQIMVEMDKLPAEQRQQIQEYSNNMFALQDQVMNYFTEPDANGVLQVKERFANPNRLGPNQKPLTIDDVLKYRLFIDDFINQGLVSEVRNAIAKGADMGLLGSDLTSVLNNERLDIAKQEENNIIALTKIHNSLLNLESPGTDVQQFMDHAGEALLAYKVANQKEQNKISRSLDDYRDLMSYEGSNIRPTELRIKVESALGGKALEGDILKSVLDFDNTYTKLTGGAEGSGESYVGRKTLGEIARRENDLSRAEILGSDIITRDDGTAILGRVKEEYNKVRLKADGTAITVAEVFPELADNASQLKTLNNLVAGAGSPLVTQPIAIITPASDTPRTTTTPTETGERMEVFDTTPETVQINPKATIDSIIAARSQYNNLQTQAIDSGNFQAAKLYRESAAELTNYLKDVPGFEKANEMYSNLANPINNWFGYLTDKFGSRTEKAITDYNLPSEFVLYAIEQPQIAANYVTGNHKNSITGEVIDGGYQIFGPKTKNIVTQAIAHMIEDNTLSLDQFGRLERNFLTDIFPPKGEPTRGLATGQKQIVLSGQGKELQNLITAKESLPSEIKQLVRGQEDELNIAFAKYQADIANIDTIVEGTVAGVGPKNERAFIDKLGTNIQGMNELKTSILELNPNLTEVDYNSAVMTLTGEMIYEDLASVSVKGFKPTQMKAVSPLEIDKKRTFTGLRDATEIKIPSNIPLREQMQKQGILFDEIIKGQSDAYAAIIKKYDPIIRAHGTDQQIADLDMSGQVRKLMKLTTDKVLQGEKSDKVLNIPQPMPIKTMLSLVNSYQRQVIGGRWLLTMAGINSARNRNARFLTNILMNPASRDVIYKLSSGKAMSEAELTFAEALLFTMFPSSTDIYENISYGEAKTRDEEMREEWGKYFEEKFVPQFIKNIF
jgi:hypothetical protein